MKRTNVGAHLCAFIFLTLSAFGVQAQEKGVWQGAKMTFVKADSADWLLAENQDRLTDSVWITRQHDKSIFNIRANSSYTSVSPVGTQWSFGTTADIGSLTFTNWITAVNNKPNSAVNKDMVVFLVADSVYVDIKFTSFSGGGTGGGFSYIRSTDCRSYSNQTLSACDAYTSPSGKVWTTSGTYQDTISNDAGCDSILTISLTINTVNNAIVASGDTLTAVETGAVYQWLDCSDNSMISGEDKMQFITTKSGNFALDVTKDGCRDTSDCVMIANSGIAAWQIQGLEIYPNPTEQTINLQWQDIAQNIHIAQYSLQGVKLADTYYTNTSHASLELSGSAGTYVLVVTLDDAPSFVVRVVKEGE